MGTGNSCGDLIVKKALSLTNGDDADALSVLKTPYIYIYIYIYRLRETERERETRHILLRRDQFLAISSQRVNAGGGR